MFAGENWDWERPGGYIFNIRNSEAKANPLLLLERSSYADAAAELARGAHRIIAFMSCSYLPMMILHSTVSFGVSGRFFFITVTCAPNAPPSLSLFPHLDLALPTSLSFLSLPVLSPFLCSRCIPVGPRREERIPTRPAAGGAASRRRGRWEARSRRAAGRRRGEALRAGGRGRRCGDGLAAGGAAALAPAPPRQT